jgi:glycosyltransferase involved in cell wall biosynthesis
MRILHVDSARTWRGGQNQVLLTALGMRRRGDSVSIACQRGGALAGRAGDEGLTVHPLSFRGDLWPAAAWGLGRLIRDLRPDVVHLHDPHAISAGLFATRSKASPPIVATRRVDFPVAGTLSKLKYRTCRGVIAVSRAIVALLVDGGISSQKIRLVYEGVPDRVPEPGGREIFDSWGFPRGSPVVGNVAELTGHKDHATLLEAIPRVLAQVPDAFFVIAGDGELRFSLEDRARALGIGARCLFTGFRKDLDRLIPAFSVFCLSSRTEGLGTSLLDAMAFSRPIVATAAGGIPEAVVDGVTGRLVPPGDADALASALVEVLQDPSLQASLGSAGRSRFLSLFTADRMVDATLDAYRALV